ncbi:MAG: DUF368 domain-containing protein [Bacillota bacterium]|nr:DUF368 domain-containing protein [Bacillota bacterium]
MYYLKNTLYGLLIGIANAIPGVSGGTMAVILDIYDDIMFSISKTNIKSHLKFLVPLAAGAVIGIFALSKVIVGAMESHPVILNFCFIGLVVGSMPALAKKTQNEGDGKIKPVNWIFFVVAFLVMLALAIVNPDAVTNKSLEAMGGLDMLLIARLFVCSAIAMVAMILPGLSGSLILLLFGIYGVIMEAVATFNMGVIIPVFLGIAAGGILGVKFIKNLLRFHPQVLYCAILGLMIGSVLIIWPGFAPGLEGVLAVVGFVGFTAVAYLLSSRK